MPCGQKAIFAIRSHCMPGLAGHCTPYPVHAPPTNIQTLTCYPSTMFPLTVTLSSISPHARSLGNMCRVSKILAIISVRPPALLRLRFLFVLSRCDNSYVCQSHPLSLFFNLMLLLASITLLKILFLFQLFPCGNILHVCFQYICVEQPHLQNCLFGWI